jgi:hypothetical protein
MNPNGVLLVAACALFVGLPTSRAAGENLSLELSTELASRYLYRGVERSAENWQTAIEGSVDGWQGRVWSELPFDSEAPGEVQSTLGYAWSHAERWTVEVKGTHFWYLEAPVDGAPSHSFEGAVEMSWNTGAKWRPAIEVAYDIRYRSLSMEAMLAREFVSQSRDTVLNLRGYGGQVVGNDLLPETAGPPVRDTYTYLGAEAIVRYQFHPHWNLKAEASLVGTANQANIWSPLESGSSTRGWLAIGVTFNF